MKANMNATYEYTTYMEGVMQNLADKISYCQEDVWEKWNEVCRMKGTSAYIHRQKELSDMLMRCGIDCADAKTDEDWQACIRKVLPMAQRDEEIFMMLHEIYQEFPASGNYMERLVRRLGDPAFQKDAVRLAILKQFLQETDYQTKPILKWAKEQYGLAGKVGSTQLREEAVAVLTEDIFDLLSAEFPVAEWIETFQTKMDEAYLRQVVTEESAAFLQMLEAADYDPKWTFDRKLVFLQQHLELINGNQQHTELVSEFLEQAEEAMYKLFRGKKDKKEIAPKKQYRERKKYIAKKNTADPKEWGLLYLADDLAVGRFRASNDTKTALYLFAFAFSMTVSAGEGDTSYDPIRDLEKNLFHDYYQDSLVKYISADYRKYSSIYAEPSGEGINYKNFAETIYLYALHRKSLTAREKIKLAERLIGECIEEAKNRKDSSEEENLFVTEIYKEFFFDDVLTLQEEEFVAYILENYEIPADVKPETVMLVASDQVTAAYTYEKIVKDLQKYYADGSISMDRMNWVDMRDYPKICEEDSDFKKILEKMNEMLHIKATQKQLYAKQENDKRPMKTAVSTLFQERDRVSRLELIAACFYRYSLSERGEDLSLPELIEDFRAEVDPLLEQCRYQKISMKNMFDMFVLFLLYRISA